jgi:uncharacterized Ntn-hydrolase superfamily protein
MPFEEGKSGNPGGRPKRAKMTYDALMVELTSRSADGDKRGMRAIAIKVVDLAESGERWATEFIRDTIDGKPIQAVEGELKHTADDTIAGLLARVATEGKRLASPPEDDNT